MSAFLLSIPFVSKGQKQSAGHGKAAPSLTGEMKKKDKALWVLTEQLTQGEDHKLPENILLPKGCISCRVPEQVLLSLAKWRLILNIGSISYSVQDLCEPEPVGKG